MSTGADVATYLDVLFARARPSTLVELRWRAGRGMARRFVRVADRRSVAQLVLVHAPRTDVYVGVLPRWRRAGGRAAVVGDGRTVWVDLDSDVAARALEPVDPPPSLVIASGGPGHLHAYWSLSAGAPPRTIERANRRLAWALCGDLHSTDAARILRPAGTVHHGRGRAPVVVVGADPVARCRLGELVGGLLDPPSRSIVGRARAHSRSIDPLLRIEPERYVTALTGLRVDRDRKVRCPLHDDRTASLHVYEHPSDGWYCFGCGQGGSVFDLAAALWGIEPRSAGFIALRAALQQRFGIR